MKIGPSTWPMKIVAAASRRFVCIADESELVQALPDASAGGVTVEAFGEPSALDGKNGLWEGIHRVPKTLEQMDKPVIAMINGVTVGAGSDGVRDAWTPFGNADMLERAMLLAWRNGFRTDPLLHATLDVVTQSGALAGPRAALKAGRASLAAFQRVLEGLRLLEDDSLGGGGSRGSGRVKFANLKLIWRNREYYASGGLPKELISGADVAAPFESFTSAIISSSSSVAIPKCGVNRSEFAPPWITPRPRSRSHSSVEPTP